MNIIINHLNAEEKRELLKVIKEFDCIFPNENEILTHCNSIKHEIKTTDEISTILERTDIPNVIKRNLITRLTNS